MTPRGGGSSLGPDQLSRRRFLQYSGVLGSAALLAACGDDEPSGSGGGDAAKDLKVRIAYTAGTFPSIVNGKVGPLDYGSKFGLNVTKDDLLTFDSHATATQAVLAGNADVLAGSFAATLLLIQQGQDFKYFCPFSNGNDLLLVGTKNVDNIQKLTDKNVRIGIDSVGGLVNFVTNALLAAKGLNVNVETLNTQIIEDSPLRTAALVNGDIQASLVHQFDIPAITEKLGAANVHVLATLWKDTKGLVFETFAARTKWLDENQDAATALTKAMLTGNRELSKSFETYKGAITKYVEGGAPDETLKTIWDLARQYEFWSWNGDLQQEQLEFTVQVAKQSGTFKGDVDLTNVVDRRFMAAALADIGPVTKEQILAG